MVKGKILISGIGRDILIYKITPPEHSNFKEPECFPKRMNSSKPRPQFKRLSQNALFCLKNKKTFMRRITKPKRYDNHRCYNKKCK